MWQDLVITLLHTLWQGALAAGLLFALLRRIPATRPGARYAASLATMGLIVIAACATWSVRTGAWESHRTRPTTQSDQPIVQQAGGERIMVMEESRGMTPEEPPVDWAWWAARAWMAGVAVMLLRAGVLVCDAHGLRRRCRVVEEGSVRRIVDELARQMGIRRRVKVAEGDGVGVPCVLGVVWPVILLPAAIASGVSTAELRMLLAHELAHVRRYDYLVNLLQMLVEAVLFFNPAVWWVSRQVRVEREACCDAIAVRVTNEPVRYAEVLAEWARGMTPATAMGTGGDGKSGGLADRVYRILMPGYRPEVRMGVGKLVVVMALGMGLMAGVWRGTDAAVALAAEVLSPAERVAQIRRETERVMPVAETMAATDDPKSRVTLSGHIRTADGGPVGNGWLHAHVESTRMQTGMTVTDLKDSDFTGKVPPGVIKLMAMVEGYAPAQVGPFVAGPGGKVEGIEIVVDRGFTGRVALVGEAGEPLANQKIAGYAEFEGGGSYRDWTTDDQGILKVEHAAQRPYTFNARVPGYEAAERNHVQLSADETVRWVLRPAKRTTGIVVDDKAQPVPGVNLRIFGEEIGDEGVQMQAWTGPVVGKTDDHGSFTLDTLKQGVTYTLLVELGKDKGRLVRGVRAGDTGLKVVIGPGPRLIGRVTGDLSRLKQKNGVPVVNYSQTVSIRNHSHQTSGSTVPVTVSGNEGRFEIKDLWPGKVHVAAGGQTQKLDIAGDELKEVVIDLSDRARPATRPVVVTFKSPAGSPPLNGTVLVQSNLDASQGAEPIVQDDTTIHAGKVTAAGYVGGRLYISPRRLIGGWFKETYDTTIPPGDGPFAVEVPVIEAGAIAGRILDENGRPAGREVTLSARVVEKSPRLPQSTSISVDNVNPFDGNFILSPLPLGGTYVVEASRGKTYVYSDPIKVDEMHPMPRVELKLVKGVSATVEVIDWNGRRVAGVPVDFSYDSGYLGHGYSPLPLTDENGRLTFEGLNPAAPGPKNGSHRYTVRLVPTIECQPTARVELRLDGTPTLLQLQKGNVLEGRVLDAATGQPVVGAEVYATPAGTYSFDRDFKAEARTDQDGRFRFSTLGQAKYSIHVRESGRMSSDENVVEAGIDKNVDLSVSIPAWNRKMVKAKQ